MGLDLGASLISGSRPGTWSYFPFWPSREVASALTTFPLATSCSINFTDSHFCEIKSNIKVLVNISLFTVRTCPENAPSGSCHPVSFCVLILCDKESSFWNQSGKTFFRLGPWGPSLGLCWHLATMEPEKLLKVRTVTCMFPHTWVSASVAEFFFWLRLCLPPSALIGIFPRGLHTNTLEFVFPYTKLLPRNWPKRGLEVPGGTGHMFNTCRGCKKHFLSALPFC